MNRLFNKKCSKYISSSFIVLFLLMFFSNVYADTYNYQAVRNGDFENQENYWVGDTESIIYDTPGVLNGNYFAFMGYDNINSSILQMSMQLPSDAQYINIETEYLYWDDPDAVGGYGAVSLHDSQDGTVLDAAILYDEDDTGMDTWVLDWDITSLKGKSVDVMITVFNEASYSNRMLVDNVGIYVTTESGELYRFWSSSYNGHFYTTSQSERDGIRATNPNWSYEGQVEKTIDSDNPYATPVYRFWSDKFKHHFYTTSSTEARGDPNWRYEAIAYYAYSSSQDYSKPVYRFWSDQFNGHFYTSSGGEKSHLINNDPNWRYEGVAWYLPN